MIFGTRQRIDVLCTALLVGMLASCVVPRAHRVPPSQPAPQAPMPNPAMPVAPPTQVERWQVSSEQSLITIEVWRAGSMARLGHNHVIAARQITGELLLAQPLQRSTVTLSLPVAAFSVDEPPLRALAGADFSAAVPDSARTATRANMLGAGLLDAGRFPEISLQSQSILETAAGVEMALQIRLRDQVRVVPLAITLTRSNGTLTARGELSLRQSELGLTPFSVMMGALQVQDLMHLRFSIVAQRTGHGA